MIETLDENIGRVLDCLEENGLADNTLVIFTSDNGGLSSAEGSPTCNSPLAEGKGWLYEGGIREPLLVRWPRRVTPDSVCSEPVTSTDFYPTILAALDLPLRPDQHVDGVSFLPALEEQPFSRGPIYWHYPHYSNQGGTPGCAMREGRWKLIEFFEYGNRELYDLAAEPDEGRNLSRRHLERTLEMSAQLHAWLDDVSARLPTPNPDWEE
jgi:arylsulfatase A-like enzyme